MIKKLLKWLWKGSADEHIEQKEYESTSEMAEESILLGNVLVLCGFSIFLAILCR